MKELKGELELPEYIEWAAFLALDAEEAEDAREGKQPRPPVTKDVGKIKQWFGRN